MYSPGRIGWFLTKVNPSQSLETIEPSDDFSVPSVPYLGFMKRGISEAGTEKRTPIINTACSPICLYAKENSKGVRIELICDRQGFWLKPHCDIKEKLISGLMFANPFNESENLGTDFYDKKLNKVKTVPFKNNYGYFFTSGKDTWHGMEKKEIKKERRCIQVNYVTFATDWKVK